MPAGALERRIERQSRREATSTGVLAAFQDDEIEGYGANCRWSHLVNDE
jgi:hypothetical protein